MNFYAFAEKGQIGVSHYKVKDNDIIERNQTDFYTWDLMLSLNELKEVSVKFQTHDSSLQNTSDKIKITVFQWKDKEANSHHHSYFSNSNTKTALEWRELRLLQQLFLPKIYMVPTIFYYQY